MKKYRMLLAAMLAVLTLAGCRSEPAWQTKPTNTGATSTVTTAEDYVPLPAPENSVTVTTDYGNLYYQDQWIEFMSVHQGMDGNVLTVSFFGKVEEQQYPLFRLLIGDRPGEPVGMITDATGVKRSVYLEMMDWGDISQLSSTHQNRLFALKEEINYIIDKLA